MPIGDRSERRIHRRFDMSSSGGRLACIQTAGSSLELEHLDLADLSQSGMCICGATRLREGDSEHFILDVREPLPAVVLVRGEVRWVQHEVAGKARVGVRFLESSKAWLGSCD